MKKIINKGFTLIELLIVMAILGVLAVVVLVAINPAEQLARTRDSGRVSSVTQIGHAVQAYYTSKSDFPVATDGSWITDSLVASGEMGSVPGEVEGTGTYSKCAGVDELGWCYIENDPTDTIVYAKLESKQYDDRCPDPAGDTAWILYSTIQGKGGVVCTDGSDPGATGTYVFE